MEEWVLLFHYFFDLGCEGVAKECLWPGVPFSDRTAGTAIAGSARG